MRRQDFDFVRPKSTSSISQTLDDQTQPLIKSSQSLFQSEIQPYIESLRQLAIKRTALQDKLHTNKQVPSSKTGFFQHNRIKLSKEKKKELLENALTNQYPIEYYEKMLDLVSEGAKTAHQATYKNGDMEIEESIMGTFEPKAKIVKNTIIIRPK